MLTKLAALVKSKVALAALGALLVGGVTTAAVVAAHNQTSTSQTAAHNTTHTKAHATPATNKANDGSQTEGLLTACNVAARTIKVTDEQGKAHTYMVNASTQFVVNADAHASGATKAYGLKQLCRLTGKVKVQVQATGKTSGATSTLTAEKITVEGRGTGADQGDDNGARGD